jgi:hypothetical protein
MSSFNPAHEKPILADSKSLSTRIGAKVKSIYLTVETTKFDSKNRLCSVVQLPFSEDKSCFEKVFSLHFALASHSRFRSCLASMSVLHLSFFAKGQATKNCLISRNSLQFNGSDQAAAVFLVLHSRRPLQINFGCPSS